MHHLDRKQRPLAQLANQHLLCSGWLVNWRDSSSGLFKEICLESVECQDWSTGKQQLALLEHCWVRVTQEYWETLYRLGLRDGYQTSRLDKLLFVARPEYYRRRDASQDWGLCLLSFLPTTERQAWGVYTDFRKLSKPQAIIRKPFKHYRDSLVTGFFLEQKIEDWRLYSRRGPEHALDVCNVLRRNAEAGLRSQLSQAQIEKAKVQILAHCQAKANTVLMKVAKQQNLSNSKIQAKKKVSK